MSQTEQTTIVEIHYDPDCKEEQIEHVVAALERWSRRTARHVTHQRVSDRHAYRTTVIVEPDDGPTDAEVRRLFHIPTRNVSKTGLGLIAPPLFMPKLLSDTTPVVHAESLFRVGMRIKVTLGPPTGMMPTLSAQIVRVRPVHFGFLELGVQFLERDLDNP